jgi:hypothetical protein
MTGVFINAISWGNNPCYTLPEYRLGRTAVHETGHYLGLLHIWGDDGSACTGDDFKSLTAVGSSCILPAGLFNPSGAGQYCLRYRRHAKPGRGPMPAFVLRVQKRMAVHPHLPG